ncbi:MAG: hypothetical protein SAJ12_08970 [Jaaginema sp. PMC 1079.18]|nr:hypothetical protein [Jaaginema sp. PMC 1080.18]MEC4851132.1 hypothetical protein [Jaaginema sp. PMC 1079.18]MEC4866372.1 hypothetical protein [Jaaginema sp. PMC 1078.18]
MEEKKEYGNKAQGQSQEIRSEQASRQPNAYPRSDRTVGSFSQGTENQPFRTGGTDRTGGGCSSIPGFDLAGGILDQLIEDTRDRLVKSQDCIKWYEDEKAEYEAKLNKLQKIKELAEQQRNPDQSP